MLKPLSIAVKKVVSRFWTHQPIILT